MLKKALLISALVASASAPALVAAQPHHLPSWEEAEGEFRDWVPEWLWERIVAAITCDDRNPCTDDTFDPTTDKCVHTPTSCKKSGPWQHCLVEATQCDVELGCIWQSKCWKPECQSVMPDCCSVDTDCEDGYFCTELACSENALKKDPGCMNLVCQPCKVGTSEGCAEGETCVPWDKGGVRCVEAIN